MKNKSIDYNNLRKTNKSNLILFLNRCCPVGCISCNAGASIDYKKHLTSQWLETFFTKAIDNLIFSGYVIWTGGEPFMTYPSLERGVSLASNRGFYSEILTSAIWYGNRPEYLKRLSNKGAFSLRISMDAEHQDKVPLSTIIELVTEADAGGIEVNFTLRKIPGRKEQVESFIKTIKDALPDYYHRRVHHSRWLHYLPHMPVTPENKEPTVCMGHPSKMHRKDSKKGLNACKMGFKDIIIGEDGLLYPCCGLFGIPDHQIPVLGNPLTETWKTLEAKSWTNPLFHILKTRGPYGICRELGLDPDQWNWGPYETPCHLCLALFHLHGGDVMQHYQ